MLQILTKITPYLLQNAIFVLLFIIYPIKYMIFKRKISEELRIWKKDENRKPLIVRGARQVGKSTLIANFGKQYPIFITLNLEKSKDKRYFTDYGDDVAKIMEVILLEKGISSPISEILLFIDEIQEVPNAIRLLRYFHEELPKIHVIAAGSLLEFALKDISSFPVGRVRQLALHPFDFEEFLMAIGQDIALKYLRTIPLPDVAYSKLLELFHQYLIIGGMPEIIKMYAQNNQSMLGLQNIYSSIWDNYADDVEKYASNNTSRKVIRHIMDTAPYVRDRVSFAGFGQSNYKSREVSEAFQMLDKARLIRIIQPTTAVIPPPLPHLRRKPKLQFLDTGLLNYASNIQAEMYSVKDFNSFYKGFIINHIIFQEMIAQSTNIHYKPHFWTRENANANAEVDIIHQYQTKLIPIEIKSGAKGRLRSLHEFMDRTNHTTSIRFLANKMSIEDVKTSKGKSYKLLNLPYFCASQLDGYLEWFAPINESLNE